MQRIGAIGLVAMVATAGCTTGGGGGGGTTPYPSTAGPATMQLPANTVSNENPPPPLSGGTLAVDRQANIAVAADPDRDRVYIVDLRTRTVLHNVALAAGDEPGRVALDSHGGAHIALRGSGALLSLDVGSGQITARRAACALPRGVAYDASHDQVYVACQSGEVVAFHRDAMAAVWTRRVDSEKHADLRDVVVDGDTLYVSEFRTARVHFLNPSTGDDAGDPVQPPVLNHQPTGSLYNAIPGHFEPSVAWRMIAAPGGGVAMVHQRSYADQVTPRGSAGYYGGYDCGSGIVQSTVTFMQKGDNTATARPSNTIDSAILPVDVAVSRDGSRVAVVAAANTYLNPAVPTLIEVNKDALTTSQQEGYSNDPYSSYESVSSQDCAGKDRNKARNQPDGEPIALAYFDDGNEENLVVQQRGPSVASLYFVGDGTSIVLDDTARDDTGYQAFHGNSGGNIACASCHAEADDDGRVWHFDVGPRRTQTFRGGFLATAPFHWDGSLPDMDHLMTEVFVGRMSGPELTADQKGALTAWINRLPHLAVPAPADAAAAARGRAIFNDATVACATCHSGDTMTNGQTVNIGLAADTAGDHASAFQVPSLHGLIYRAPYMHTGTAATLRDRFNPSIGGTAHGNTSQLSDAEISDLIAYLETL